MQSMTLWEYCNFYFAAFHTEGLRTGTGPWTTTLGSTVLNHWSPQFGLHTISFVSALLRNCIMCCMDKGKVTSLVLLTCLLLLILLTILFFCIVSCTDLKFLYCTQLVLYLTWYMHSSSIFKRQLLTFLLTFSTLCMPDIFGLYSGHGQILLRVMVHFIH